MEMQCLLDNSLCEFTNANLLASERSGVALRAGLSNIPPALQPPRYACAASSVPVAAFSVFPIPNPVPQLNVNGKLHTQGHPPHGLVLEQLQDSAKSEHIFQPGPCPHRQFL